MEVGSLGIVAVPKVGMSMLQACDDPGDGETFSHDGQFEVPSVLSFYLRYEMLL